MQVVDGGEAGSAVDAVITWVDGNDPQHQERKAAAMRAAGFSHTAIPAGRNVTRFADNGEVRFCIHSIRRFLPWIRRIHLVTDAQCPTFLDADARERLGVVLVDHRQLFAGYEWALPTFNSRTIETALHRIPGLADRFVYFNDDTFVMKDTDVGEFFLPDGVVLRGNWSRLETFGRFRVLLSSIANHVAERLLGKVRSMHVLPQQRAARLAGMDGDFFQVAHVPYPMRKRGVQEFFERNKDAFDANIRYRFRDMEQFLVTSLANHLEIAAGTYRESRDADHVTICFNRNTSDTVGRKLKQVMSGDARFLCVQSLEQARPEWRESLLDHLERTIIAASPSETQDRRAQPELAADQEDKSYPRQEQTAAGRDGSTRSAKMRDQ